MRYLTSSSNNPYFNLAMEEYLLKNNMEEILLLYINEPCIVAGKHQNILSEIDLQFAINNNIKLARRISGGGTVYQDLNNLNFCFIHNCSNYDKINFNKFILPVTQVLRQMGLEVQLSNRKDLLINQKKISGNAMHIFKNRVMSHGTLLYKTDLYKLSRTLKNQYTKYIDKSIKSTPAKVTNISSYIDIYASIFEFTNKFIENIDGIFDEINNIPLSEHETEKIKLLSKNKFETWEWIYGYSPKYQFINSFTISGLFFMVEIQVEKGLVKSIHTKINSLENLDYQKIFEPLINVKHDYKTFYKILTQIIIINRELRLLNPNELCIHLF